ncbi:MAG: DUF4011 domain-containing protein [Ilumatobacteraceae bacterium]
MATVDIAMDCIDTYSYTIAHRPVLRTLTLTNVDTPTDNGDLVVRITISSGTTEPLLHDKTFEIPALLPRDTKTFRAIRIEPNHRELALLDEQITGDLTVTVTAAITGEVLATARQPVTFLAYNQWMHRPEFYDSFSSFVLPNHRALAPAMSRSRELLGERTGSAMTEGYQGGDPARLSEIAKAVFDALAEQQLAYSNPPASFEGSGQKIRTPDLMFGERCATCLDSAVLYASCLAAAGLDPVLVLSTGHAMAGYWTRRETTPELRELETRPVLDNPNDIAALVAAGALQIVETTAFTVNVPPYTYEQAVAHNAALFTSRVSELEALVNVRAARASGVRPIPGRRFVAGMIEILHEQPVSSAGVWEPPPDRAAGEAGTSGNEWTPTESERRADTGAASSHVTSANQRMHAFEAPPRVRAWLKSLLDLSFANPLIDLRPGKSSFRFELPPGMLDAVEDRLMQGGNIELLPASRVPARVLDADDLGAALLRDFTANGQLYSPDVATLEPAIDTAKRAALAADPTLPPARAQRAAEDQIAASMSATLESSISLLRRKAREIESQAGSNNLFLTIGALRWTEPPVSGQRKREGPATAPLFLIPVRISGSANSSFRIKIDEAAEVTPNYCLLEKLRQTFDLVIPELETPDLDAVGIDVDATIAAVRRALGDKRLHDVIVEETAHLAVLNFTTFRLWKDMRDHWPQFMENAVVNHLVTTPYEAFENEVPSTLAGPDATTEDLLCPIEIDESQLDAVRWAVQGRSFVIEGPPGTGKSQTITNLLAACIGANKRVLFVAEKQPALQVVKKRLEQIGLTPFCIDLHDKGSKPEQIRKQVRDALDFAGTDREAEWVELSARLSADERDLAAYRDVIHSIDPAGYSAWTARQELVELDAANPAGQRIDVDVPESFIDEAPMVLPEVREALLALPSVASVARLEPSAPWTLADRTDFVAIDQAGLTAMITSLQSTLHDLSQLPQGIKQVLARLTTPDELATVIATVDAALTTGIPTDTELAVIGGSSWIAARDTAVARLDVFTDTSAPLLQTFGPSIFTADLAPIIAATTEAASAGFFSRSRRHRAMALLLSPFRIDSSDRKPEQYLALLQQVAPAKAEMVAIAAQFRAIAGVRLDADWSPVAPGAPGASAAPSASAAPLASAALDDVDQLRARLAVLPAEADRYRTRASADVRAALAAGWVPDARSMAAIAAARDGWQQLTTMLGATSASIERWRNGHNLFDAWARSQPGWAQSAPRLLALQRWCDLLECLAPVTAAGLTDLTARVLAGQIDLADVYDTFRRGLVTTALRERLEAGRVDQFDGLAHDRRVQTFIARAAQKRQLMRTVIPTRLVQSRPFRPGTRFGEYGALERELSKTTRRLSIRRLIERYGEILPGMTPCFLMSPDSVARFLPPGAVTFDVVVFDEASQIEVAEAIGAMGRAKAVVVVGDSQQMPPSTFGGSSGTGDGDDLNAGLDGVDADQNLDQTVFEDLESILSECVESNLPRLYLQCHYRSRHEGLIAFSNAAFYEGKLTTFPSPAVGQASPIHWRRIDGHFDRAASGDDKRTNRAEADAIVVDIARRLDDPATAHQSICVVTLNVQQQALILRLLDESGDERIRTLLDDEGDDGLIVRNLESVQGDERDVVLISIAFAPIERTLVNGTVSRRLPLNFGPLNRKGGERRLNVAVTRARSEVTVFCSFEPEEMRLAETPSKGLQLLQQYLAIARDGTRTSGDLIAREQSAPDHHRRAVAAALRARGLRVAENVGLSTFRVDLAVGMPDRDDWQVAILLDGPGWAARSTVYDRDALPVSVLTVMGWQRVLRVWLPSWLQEPQRVLDDIVAAVDAAQHAPEPPPPPPPPPPLPPPLPPPILEPVAVVATGSRTRSDPLERIFTEAPTTVIGDRDLFEQLDRPNARRHIVAAIDETLAAEAPIHTARLAKIVATRFGIERVTKVRADSIVALAGHALRRDHDDFGSFLWTVDPETWRNYRRTPDGVDRKLEHIPAEEIANAMVDITSMGLAIVRSQLHREIADVFDIAKVTAPVRAVFDAVIDSAINSGRLIDVDGSIRLAKQR